MAMADALDIAAEMLYAEVDKALRASPTSSKEAGRDLHWRAGFMARCELISSPAWMRRQQFYQSLDLAEYPSTMFGLPFETDQSIPLDELRLMRGENVLASATLRSTAPAPVEPYGPRGGPESDLLTGIG